MKAIRLCGERKRSLGDNRLFDLLEKAKHEKNNHQTPYTIKTLGERRAERKRIGVPR